MINFENFNWLKALETARDEGVSLGEHDRLIGLAVNWPTCACGELCRSLPRSVDGSPKDNRLYEMGFAFVGRVQCGEWVKAIEVFRNIETRTGELLRQMK